MWKPSQGVAARITSPPEPSQWGEVGTASRQARAGQVGCRGRLLSGSAGLGQLPPPQEGGKQLSREWQRGAEHLCSPCSTEWPDWRVTPPARPGSLLRAPAQRHPALRWPCLPRTGPKRHHRWLPQAGGEGGMCPELLHNLLPTGPQFAQSVAKGAPKGKPQPPYSIPAGTQGPSPGGRGHPSATVSPGW